MNRQLISFIILLNSVVVMAEDGHELWLRLPGKGAEISAKQVSQQTPLSIAEDELRRHWKGAPVKIAVDGNLLPEKPGQEGFMIESEKGRVKISACSGSGALYGAYHLLRLQQCGEMRSDTVIKEAPVYDIRVLNHWDNLDGTIERGYAGRSLWNWEELPEVVSPAYAEYARANASVGINGTVLNNVNANPLILSDGYLRKVATLADQFRPYGIKVYLSINFSSPMALDSLPTADPLDSRVIEWWNAKVKEIYTHVPDFGGFLVKANSEGLPGPQDFGRTHADGANMLADALKPFDGLVMWRSFVYNPSEQDRAKQAYQEFMPFDGKFRDNVIIQVKNGPVDFQPREPISPLFGAMKNTPVMAELQITQEYTGFSNHLCYLAPMWKEVLDTDTHGFGAGSTVWRVTSGEYTNQRKSAIAGVANTGNTDNWCGHHFAQSNWYAFGRLAWNPELGSGRIASEWLTQTFDDRINPGGEFAKKSCGLVTLMNDSWEAVVDYMMPLGLHHLFAWGHHYGPEPWCDVPGARPDWMPSYYHKATGQGIGFDRSSSGSNATAQYSDSLRTLYDNRSTCPDNLLLWFHHVGWDHEMQSGRTLWQELCMSYDRGVDKVRGFGDKWGEYESVIDTQRYSDIAGKFGIQLNDAIWWKDACLLYFSGISGCAIPAGIEAPVNSLDEMMRFRLEITNFECPATGFRRKQ